MLEAIPDQGPADALENVLLKRHRTRRRLAIVAGIALVLMIIEIVAGQITGALILWADAAHYLADVGAVLLAFAAATISRRAATSAKTFGYHRSEVIAAFVNALAIWGLAIYILVEAAKRFADPTEIDGRVVAMVGLGTLIVNVLLFAYLRQDTADDPNAKGALLHVLADVFGSASAIAAGLLASLAGLHVADPVLSVVVTVILIVLAYRLTRRTVHILMEGTPPHLDVAKIREELRSVDQVKAIHDLHVWTLTPGVESLSVHVVLSGPASRDGVTRQVHLRLRESFGISHATVQVEDPDFRCEGQSHTSPK